MESLAGTFTFLIIFSLIITTSYSRDIIAPGQSLRDGETLASAGGIFQLGFFSPPYVSSRYLGIWYKNITPQTVVWVANREHPIRDTSGALNLTSRGELVIFGNGGSSTYWSSSMTRAARDPVAQLLDSGNLVVRERNDENPDRYLWQGFDCPCDTWLPGMVMGKNFHTGLERSLSAWRSPEDPARGEFSTSVDARGYPQIVFRKGREVIYRAGSWNGITWTGTPHLLPGPSYKQHFHVNETEVSSKYEVEQDFGLTRYSMSSSGLVQQFMWDDQSYSWLVVATVKADLCESYALCGAYASCNFGSSAICSCVDGFVPNSPIELNSSDWSRGCIRKTQLDCRGRDGFVKHTGKLPDTANSSWFRGQINLEQCQEMCLKNCSCTAYASLNVDGTGCLLWHGELFDIRTFPIGGQDMYIRVAASQLDNVEKRRSAKKKPTELIAGSIGLAAFVLVLAGIYIALHRRKIRKFGIEAIEKDMEMRILDPVTITDATNNFSSGNKLGEGGFGTVYKGTLLDGQEIAVKRLSKNSGQGLNEFKTEATLIAKLQHRNLVKLLGCCISKDEKMLVYEYLPNKSLDSFIFDKTKSELLDWPKRMNIIEGVARGILYLHQDSRLRIIHRDLKASNILLDSNLNPKISDFGLARSFGTNQTEANTRRIIGTYGYMAPEYAMDGLFSVKSDVFSFGVLVLEIVSGKKNRGFNHPDYDLNLLGYVWMLWAKGMPLQLVDECLLGSCNCYASQVTRCINVALLCVQQRPQDRPTMSAAVLMLGSENLLPEPKQPGFFAGSTTPSEARPSPSDHASSYVENSATLSLLEPR